MPTRRRIHGGGARSYGGGGGGGGTVGNVVWGPDFGEPSGSDDNTWTVGVRQEPMTELAVESDKNVGVTQALTAIDLENTKSVGVNMDLEDVGPMNDKSVGANMDLEAVDVENNKNVGVQQTLTAIDVENEKSLGVNLDLEAVDVENDESVRATLVMDAVDLENTKSVFVRQTLDAVDVENTKSLGVHLSGTVDSAPFYISQQFGSVDNALGEGSVTCGAPSGIQDGDLLLAFVAFTGGAVSVTPPTGFTSIRRDDSGGATDRQLQSYWKIASSESGSYVFSFSSNQTLAYAEILCIRGAHQTTPIDTHAAVIQNEADPQLASVTTSVANTLNVGHVLHDHTVSETNTPPASWSEILDTNVGTGAQLGATTAWRVFSASGLLTNLVFNCTRVVGAEYISHRIAVAPGTLTIAS